MSITCSPEPEEKKVMEHCEECDRPLYKGDKVLRDEWGIERYYYYCTHKCFDRDIQIAIVTLGEE